MKIKVYINILKYFGSSINSKRMKTKFKQHLVLLLTAFLFALTSFQLLHEDVMVGLKNGDKAPLADEAMKGIDGVQYSLNKLKKEKGLVVVFSCNSCPFVVGSESFQGWEVQYNDLNKMAKELGFGFVLVNSNEAKRSGDDSFDEMVSRAKSKAYTMPYLVDVQSKLANAFGAKTTPHVFVFDAAMTLTYQGAIDNTTDTKRSTDIPYLKNALQEMASNQTVKEGTTPPRGCSIKRVVKEHKH